MVLLDNITLALSNALIDIEDEVVIILLVILRNEGYFNLDCFLIKIPLEEVLIVLVSILKN